MAIDLKYHAWQIAVSVKYHNGKSADWLNKNIDWLKIMSRWGVDIYLEAAEREGYVNCKYNKAGELVYKITPKGRKAATELYQ